MSCQICGNESGKYPLCLVCNKLKNKGLIIKCQKCGEWHKVDQECKSIQPKSVSINENCIVCGAETKGKGFLCLNCYIEKEDLKKEFDKNRTQKQIKEHYFSQKRLLYKINSSNFEKTGLLKIIAMAEELEHNYKDNSLKDNLMEDIHSIQDFFINNKPFEKRSFDDEDFRKQFPAEHQCDDGHYVRSYSEMLIDNWLYNNGIVHAYEKSVFMGSDPDAVVLCDFYIPEGDVYIEFWGIRDEKYTERRDKKKTLYDKNNIKLIELEEKDIKRLNDIMPRKLSQYMPNKKFK